MASKILVTYATNSGTTEDVARAIAEEIANTETQVDLKSVDEITSLEDYSTVVLGGPMIMGWHRAALKFLKHHEPALAQLPVALFITCINLTQTPEMEVNGIPLSLDPKLAKPPKQAGKLSFKENHTTVGNYVRPILKAAPKIRPVSVAIFGGRLDMYRLKWWQAIFVMAIIQAAPGEKRNWDAIRVWARELFTDNEGAKS